MFNTYLVDTQLVERTSAQWTAAIDMNDDDYAQSFGPIRAAGISVSASVNLDWLHTAGQHTDSRIFFTLAIGHRPPCVII